MSKSYSRGTALAFCLFAGAAFGAQFPIAGHILQRVDPFYFVFIRYVLAAIAFSLMLAIREGSRAFRTDGQGWRIWLLGTLAFTGYNGLIFFGQHLVGPAGPILSSVMMGFMPLATAFILFLWKGTRMSPVTTVCIVIGIVGVFLVATKGDFGALLAGGATVWALLLMLAAVVCWCIFTIGGSLFPTWSPLRYTTLACLGGTLSNAVFVGIATPAGLLRSPSWGDLAANVWPFLYMALIGGFAAVLAWNMACRIISPVDAALFTNNVIPIVSLAITAMSGYRVGLPELGGVALTLAALIANNRLTRSRSAVRKEYNLHTAINHGDGGG